MMGVFHKSRRDSSSVECAATSSFCMLSGMQTRYGEIVAYLRHAVLGVMVRFYRTLHPCGMPRTIRHYHYILCLLLICFSGAAQDDFGSILSVDVTKKIVKKMNVTFEEEFRTRSNFSEAERFSHLLEANYKPLSFLKIGGAYNLMNFNHEKKGWEIRHRYYFYAMGSWDAGRFTFSLRERFQSTKRQGVPQTATRVNPKLYLRSRLKAEYNIRKSKFTPFASFELFNMLKDPQKNTMNQWRGVAGMDYKLNKKNALQFYYRYTNYTDEDETDKHLFGMAYSFKF